MTNELKQKSTELKVNASKIHYMLQFAAKRNLCEVKMSKNVIVISEWLPKENCEQDIFEIFRDLARQTLETEKGCIQYNVSTQVTHPNTTSPRDFKIMLMQEFKSIEDFEKHCEAPYVAALFDKLIADQNTSLIDNYECRVFSKAAI